MSPRPEARYANYFEIGHNEFEFIFDFGQYQPEDECGQMQCRIITAPVYAKLLAEMLSASIQCYEEEHGLIKRAEGNSDPLEVARRSSADHSNFVLYFRRNSGEADS